MIISWSKSNSGAKNFVTFPWLFFTDRTMSWTRSGSLFRLACTAFVFLCQFLLWLVQKLELWRNFLTFFVVTVRWELLTMIPHGMCLLAQSPSKTPSCLLIPGSGIKRDILTDLAWEISIEMLDWSLMFEDQYSVNFVWWGTFLVRDFQFELLNVCQESIFDLLFICGWPKSTIKTFLTSHK